MLSLDYLNNLNDDQMTNYEIFNNLRRNEKLKLIDFSNFDPNMIIIPGNPETNGFSYKSLSEVFFSDIPISKETVISTLK